MVTEKTEKFKAHIKKYKVVYVAGTTGSIFAGITYIIMRGVASQPIRGAIGVPAEGDIVVLGKKVVIGNISYISADRQGPPSWVVRCKETGEIFTSQKAAAKEMGILASQLSQHLNGVRDHVDTYHFERICMAA